MSVFSSKNVASFNAFFNIFLSVTGLSIDEYNNLKSLLNNSAFIVVASNSSL